VKDREKGVHGKNKGRGARRETCTRRPADADGTKRLARRGASVERSASLYLCTNELFRALAAGLDLIGRHCRDHWKEDA
jgi:hypothetical protein